MKGYSLIFITRFSKKEIMTLAIVLLFIVISLSVPHSNEAWAQTKHFWVTFDKLYVNDHHDSNACYVFFGTEFPTKSWCPSAEWGMIASVNGKQIDLSSSTNLWAVKSGHNYGLHAKKVEVEVPENGTLRVVTGGVDQDGGTVQIPDISSVTRVVDGIPVLGDLGAVINGVREGFSQAISLDQNFMLGVVLQDYTSINNFGVGWHREPSSINDYQISYTIEEFQPMPTDSLIAEPFVDSGFVGPSTIIRQNTPWIGDQFHDSITGVKVDAGPNYRAGDVVQLCEEIDYGGNCINLEPGNHDIGSLGFNDKVDSIRFIR